MTRNIIRLLGALVACSFAGCGGGDEAGGDNGSDTGTNTVPTNAVSTAIEIVHDFGPNDPDVYLCMGDSITANARPDGGLPYPLRLSQMLGKVVINKGIAGERAAEGAARINNALDEYQPGYVLILYGANDVIMSKPPERTLGYLSIMADRAYARDTIPVLATLLPMTGSHGGFTDKVNRLNSLIRDYAKHEGVILVDINEAFQPSPEQYLSSDGLHPDGAGTELIARTFYNTLTNIVVTSPPVAASL